MIAPFQFKKLNGKLLITNDVGAYAFLSHNQFNGFVNENLTEDDPLYEELVYKGFIIKGSKEAYLNCIRPALRNGKSYLLASTSLHIFVVTNYCNGQCVYCQAQSEVQKNNAKMSKEVARRSVDIALQSPQDELSFEFQGGEPLSNFEIIKDIVAYTESKKGDKIIHYTIVSNITLLTREMVDYIKEYGIIISVSLDGGETLHDMNRPLFGGIASHNIVEQKLNMLKENNVPFGAIQTTTRYSISMWKEVVDEYVEKEIKSVFIRPLTPLGFAASKWDDIGYSTEAFIEFYRNCLTYILKLNKEGIFISEGHAEIFLSKILNGCGMNYMELRSPCGAAIGQMAYYYDGNIFTCDEGRMLYEMGDPTFCLGNVFEDDYNSLMDSKLCKTVCRYSVIESLPGCCDCAYQPYCGTCPVINYAMDKDAISRKRYSYRCKIYMGMLDVLFELLSDYENEEVFRSWVA